MTPKPYSMLTVVPAKAGTHNHEWVTVARRWNDESHLQYPPRRMGPCFRRDDGVVCGGGRGPAARRYLIGGAYWTPPAFQSWFMPRGIFSLESAPTLRS
ncbi:hypothetical protein AB7M47_000772 [Bradyrhizobium elkanii]